MLFKPKSYYKSIYDINYDKLKEEGITCLIFDLDNTLGLLSSKKSPRRTKTLIRELQNDFLVLVFTNNIKRRLKPYLKDLGVGGVSFALKPSIFGLARIKRNYRLKKKEMAIIGDQMMTDVLCGNRFHIKTILVDPLGDKDLKITMISRKLENYVINKYSKRGYFERGKYYE